jgi:pimeloyl-ACP methyl ester carboxylesterase
MRNKRWSNARELVENRRSHFAAPLDRNSTMPTIQSSDQTSIHYRVLGNGPRTAILVHGWMVSGAVWDELVEALDLTRVRLVIPDQRGAGASVAASGFNLEQYARDLQAIADAEKVSRFTLVGHSMGGQIAQLVAASDPRVDGMVLLNSVPAGGLPLPPDAAGLFRTSGQDREKQKTILGLACKQLSEASLQRLLDDAGRISAACIEGAYDAWTKGGFADRLGRVACPTLVVATDDPFLPPAFLEQAVVSLIRGARLAHLPGPGHYPQVERPKETAAIIQAFVAGLAA